MTFLEEPGNKGSKELSDLGLTTAEISTLLTSADGHGLGNYLSDNCWNQVASGQTLKTPFRVLWYAECCGLTQTTNIDGKDDFREVSLRDILDMLNKSNEMKGKKPVSISTVYNSLSPLARQLQKAFGIKLLVNRHDETIKLLSEHWTAQFFSGLRADHERLLTKLNQNMKFAKRVGVDLTKVIAGSAMEETFALAASTVPQGDTYYATTESAAK